MIVIFFYKLHKRKTKILKEYFCSIFVQVRTAGMAIIGAFAGIFHFISSKTYPILLKSLDLHGCLMIYAFLCFIGFIFIFFALKETTGFSLDDIGMDQNVKIRTNARTKFCAFTPLPKMGEPPTTTA